MRTLSFAIVLTVVLATPAAHAQAVDPNKLFTDATALINEERYAEAIPMLEEAQRLDPGIGTQFNLAVCYENVGRLGTAYLNFRQVEQLAAATGKTARQEAAHGRVDSLRARVPYVSIRLASKAGDPAVTVRVDGAIVPSGELELVPLDPGAHTIAAVAPERKPFETSVQVEGEANHYEVMVPELAPVEIKTEVRTVTNETSNTRRTLGFVLGGVGIAGAVTAGVTGVMILSDKSTADKRCTTRADDGTLLCVTPTGDPDTEGSDAVRRGKTLLPINLIGFGVAAVGIGAGAYLLITSGRKPAPTTPIVVPTLDGRGAVLMTRF